MVRRVRGVDRTDLETIVRSFNVADGTAVVTLDGIVVVSEAVEVIEKINEALNILEESEHSSYLIQLHVVQLTDEFIHDVGLDAIPVLDLAAVYLARTTAAAASAAGSAASGGATSITVSGQNGEASLKALLRATHVDSRVYSLAQPLLSVPEGQVARHREGEQVGIKSSIRDAQTGQVDSGLQFKQVGFEVSASVQMVREGVARLALTLTDSALGPESTADNPRIVDTTCETSSDLPLGETVLIGAMRRKRITDRVGQLWSTGSKKQNTSGVWLLWAKVVRVSS